MTLSNNVLHKEYVIDPVMMKNSTWWILSNWNAHIKYSGNSDSTKRQPPGLKKKKKMKPIWKQQQEQFF